VTSRLKVTVTRRAQKHIEAAERWWSENRASAPDAVTEDLDRILRLLSVQPRIGARARRSKLSDVRRVTLSRIRYHLYYRVAGESLEVLALWHTSRGAEPKL
jgi:plasmid stabilization system protein ParE